MIKRDHNSPLWQYLNKVKLTSSGLFGTKNKSLPVVFAS
jgi:hypothetical protein